MRESEIRHTLQRAHEDLAAIIAAMPAARTHSAEWSGRGYPPGGTSSSIGTARGVNDPVGRTVTLDIENHRRDAFQLDRAQCEEDITTMHLAINRIRAFTIRHTKTIDPSKAQPTCRVCASVGYTSVVYACERCRWCWEQYRALGTEPHPTLVRAHNEGRRVTPRMIHQYHPSSNGKKANGQ